mmetsp:Transcript_31861/g.74092  ORF Transcript_31861/g.74092 Transcript_31861/m.74092 type:complete len:271 (-) Transcript_31861:1485-2297(-)
MASPGRAFVAPRVVTSRGFKGRGRGSALLEKIQASHLSRVSYTAGPDPAPLLDTGCGPVHCIRGPLTSTSRTSPLDTSSGRVHVQVSDVAKPLLSTTTSEGASISIALPGAALQSPAFNKTLVCAHSLASNGFHIDLHAPEITTPSGTTIPLHVTNGIYRLPGSSVISSNSFAPLASALESDPPDASSVPPQDDVSLPKPRTSTPLSPATLADFSKIAHLHEAHGHCNQRRLTKVFKQLDSSDKLRLNSMSSLSKWYRLTVCDACTQGKS